MEKNSTSDVHVVMRCDYVDEHTNVPVFVPVHVFDHAYDAIAFIDSYNKKHGFDGDTKAYYVTMPYYTH